MQKMFNEKIIPFQWEEWDSVDINCLLFYNVEFTDNFGTFQKGETAVCISVDYSQGVVIKYTDRLGTNEVKRQEFKCISI